jgi:hypothetical protein
VSLEQDIAKAKEKLLALVRQPTEAEKRQVIILSSFLEELKRPLYQIVEGLKILQPEQESGLLPSIREYNITLATPGGFILPYLAKQSIGASRIEIMNIVFTGALSNFYVRFEEPKDDTPIAEWFKIATADGSRDDFPRKFVGNIMDMWFNADGLAPGTISFTLLIYRNLENVLVEPLSIEDGGGSLTVDGTVAISGPVTVVEPVSVDDNGGSLTVDGSLIANPTPATSVIAGSATANAGVATQLAANVCKSVTVQAKRANTSYVEIGGSAGQTVQLDPLMAVSLDVANTNLVYFTPQVTGEGVNFIAIN